MIQAYRAHIVNELQTDILRLQGFKSSNNSTADIGLGPIRYAFPNASFPVGAVHEFLSEKEEDAAATSGFISGLLAALMENKGTSMWISSSRKLFPPALKSFGIQPDRCIFVDLKNERDAVWTIDEALKCNGLAAVVGELHELSFTNSRRLQLAVERSQVTGFILRKTAKKINTTACISRWRIKSLPCEPFDDLPGICFPKWRVELLRIRNGKPGVWNTQWLNGKFESWPVDNIASKSTIDDFVPSIKKVG